MPDTVRGEAAWRQCESILNLAVSQAEQYAGEMRLVRSGEEIDRALTAGCCAAVLAVEGGSALAGRLEHIQTLAQRGVKILTLTWNGENELGYGLRLRRILRAEALRTGSSAGTETMGNCTGCISSQRTGDSGMWRS